MAERKLIESGQNFKYYSDGTLLCQNLRFSHPHVFVPKAGTDKDGKPTAPAYSIVGLGPKTTHLAMKHKCKQITDDLLKQNKVDRLAGDKKFCRDGNLAEKDEYDDMFTVSARETVDKPPRVRGPDKSIWTPETHGRLIYGGCYGNILIRPWFQNNKYGIRVNAGLVAVQFLSDGEPFGQGRIREEDIDETFDDESGREGAYDTDDL